MSDEPATTETAQPEKPSVPSALLAVRTAWEKGGSKLPDAKTMSKLKDAYKQANTKLAQAEAAVQAAKAPVYVAARALAEAVGAQPFKMDGVRHDFSSRGANIFLKARTVEKNILDI